MLPRLVAVLIGLPALLSACELGSEVAVGSRAPAYAAADLDGGRLALDDLRGEVVLLNVWATWCLPCRREMPSMEELHRSLQGQGLRVVAVSIDAAGSEGEIRKFVVEHDITFRILHDADQRVTRAFRTRGVPETFLIGRDGTLLRHWIGRIDGRSEAIWGPVQDALAAPRTASRPGEAGLAGAL